MHKRMNQKEAVAYIAAIPKQGEWEDETQEFRQNWQEEFGKHAIEALHDAIDVARAAVPSPLEAAAPDMLAALEALLTDMRECGILDYYDEARGVGMAGAIAEARAAIAKARGEG